MNVYSRLVTLLCLSFCAAALAAPEASGALLKPVFGRSIVVVPRSGAVYTGNRSPATTRLRNARALKSGSVIDVSGRGAAVELITAAPHGGATYTADLSGGVERITQPRGQGGVTNVYLIGKRAPCSSATTAKYVVRTTRMKSPSGRKGHARAARASGPVGSFRLVGENESAINTGAATWDAQDRCDGTVVGDDTGAVTASPKKGANTQSLGPGQTWLIKCSTAAQAAAVGPFCVSVLGFDRRGSADYTTGLFIKTQSSTYDLCQTGPSGAPRCQTWTLTTPDSNGFREGLITCDVSQRGDYSFNWQVDGNAVGISLPYTSAHVNSDPFPCSGTTGAALAPPKLQPIVLPSGVKVVNSYALPTAAWISYIAADIRPRQAGKVMLRGVVYQDAGGSPGALVAQTDVFTERQNQVMAYFPEPYVPAGTYWFGVLTGGTSDVIGVQAGSSAPLVSNANPFSAGASNPFGPFTSVTGQMSLSIGYYLDPPPGVTLPAAAPSG